MVLLIVKILALLVVCAKGNHPSGNPPEEDTMPIVFLFRRTNPTSEFSYDGIQITPLEVLFVKVKSFQLESEWVSTQLAVTYDRWRLLQVR